MTRTSRLSFIPLSIVSALLITSCGGGDSSSGDTPVTDNGSTIAPDTDTGVDTDSPTDPGTSTLSCISPVGDQAFPTSNFDAPSYEAFDDLFTSDPNATAITPQEVATVTAVPFAGATFLGIQGESLLLQFFLASCNYEVYAENQCQTPFFEVDDVNMTATGALSFSQTYDRSSDDYSVAMTISDSEYTSGSYQRTEENGQVTSVSWSIDSDGTERYNSSSTEGESTSFIELPDCSGTANRVLTPSDGEPGATLSATWSSPTSGAFSGTFEWCDTVEGVIQCDTFTRPE